MSQIIHLRILAGLLFCLLLCGCASLGFEHPFSNDPISGGVDSAQCRLLGIAMPVGLQVFPSHSNYREGSRREGLETLRGNVDQSACAMTFYDRLKQAGWSLRMQQRFGSRAVYVYDKNDEIAAIVFHRQGMLTIVEIWVGARLAGNMPQSGGAGVNQLPAEEYEPITESKGSPGAVEKWGVEEREL